jgi:HAD superfamily hydrolase (TIGR01509 family)
LDGTIVESGVYHKLAWQKTLQKRGVELTEERFRYSFGRRNEENLRSFFDNKLSPDEIEAISEEKEANFRQLIKANIHALPGVVKFLESLASVEFQLAIVSSTTIENIQLITETLGIKMYFSLFITAKDVTESKPSPQGYITAAKKLGVKPGNCVVIEDAVIGIKAAKSAGMRCIEVTNTSPKDNLLEADIVVDSLEKITVKTIEELFNRAKK